MVFWEWVRLMAQKKLFCLKCNGEVWEINLMELIKNKYGNKRYNTKASWCLGCQYIFYTDKQVEKNLEARKKAEGK